MSDQFYRLVESWNVNEWPLEFSQDQLRALNEVTPHGQYLLRPSHNGEDERVEFHEYVGTGDDVELY